MDTPIVIDIGTYSCKAGFAGPTEPAVTIPAVVGYPRHHGVMGAAKLPRYYVGEEAIKRRGILRPCPVAERGLVYNTNRMDDFLTHILEITTAHERPMLLTEAPHNDATKRGAVVQAAFETFRVPSLCIAPQPLLALRACGCTTGLVLESGHGYTCSYPIVDGRPVEAGIQVLELAGEDLTDYLIKLLMERGQALTTSAERMAANALKDSLCYVALDYDLEQRRAAEGSLDETYSLPYDQSAQVGIERIQVAEGLFRPSLLDPSESKEGIISMIKNSIEACDVGNRPELYKNITLSGGSTLFPGLADRIRKELTATLPESTEVKVASPYEGGYLAWLGGSMLASLPAERQSWWTKEEYDEMGPSIAVRRPLWSGV